MRSVLLVLAACGGPAIVPDAAIDAPPDAPPDADPNAYGTWTDTYYLASGPVKASACGTAPSALVIDPNTASVASYTGACHGDGSFVIHTPLGVTDYYLRAQGELFATSAHAGLDLGTDQLGRPDVTAAPGVTLSLAMTNMSAWALGDVVMAWSANVGFYESLVFTSGTPGAGDMTLTASAPWFGYKVDGSKSDVLQLFQLGTHQTAGGLAYLTLDRTYDVAPFAMMNNQTTQIPATGNAAFLAPTQSPAFLAIDGGSYDGLAAAAAPSPSSHTIGGTIYAAVTQDVIPSPPMFSFSRDSSGATTLNFGNFYFGDPFPAAWQRRVSIVESFAQSYTFNGVTSSLTAEVTTQVPFADAQSGTVVAKLGPPTGVMIDGVSAFTATTISTSPVISWSPPALGTPTDYEVTIYEVRANGSLLDFTPVVRVVTEATSLRVAEGNLLPQRQYVVAVRAEDRVGIDVTLTPFRAGMRSHAADALSVLTSTL
jgi:hypothetical protein